MHADVNVPLSLTFTVDRPLSINRVHIARIMSRFEPMMDGRDRDHGTKVALLAHRTVFQLLTNVTLGRSHLLHWCDNPTCVNPRHLTPGTHQDNVRDMVTKGRHARGERNGRSKIDAATVEQIRAALRRGETQQKIAKDFGVAQGLVSMINTGKIWRSV